MIYFYPIGFELPVQPVQQLMNNQAVEPPAAKPVAAQQQPQQPQQPAAVADPAPPTFAMQQQQQPQPQFAPQGQPGFNQGARMPNPNMPQQQGMVRGNSVPWQQQQQPSRGPQGPPESRLRAALIDPRAQGPATSQVWNSYTLLYLLLTLPIMS